MENKTPWWAVNRDRFILYAAAMMFGVLLWQIPAGIADMKIEHRHLLNVLQIQCVHDAKNNQERDECLTLELRR